MLKYFLSDKAKQARARFIAPRAGDAGFDICCCTDYQINPGELVKVETGLHLSLEQGWVAIIKDRSSIGSKGGHCLAGVIDASYRGEVLVLIKNLGKAPLEFSAGDKIAQAVIVQHLSGEYCSEVSSLDELGYSDRGAGGFGSTGV